MGSGWDIRVIWLDARQRWWWNAWHERTATERFGLADSNTIAEQAMAAAIADVERSRGESAQRLVARADGAT